MLNFLRKFFVPPTELEAITQLREAIKAIREDASRLLPWNIDPQRDSELSELQNQFTRNVEDLDLGKRLIARSVLLETEAKARAWLHSVAMPVVANKLSDRLRPALKSALDALIVSLEEELATARGHERELAAKYGVGHNDGEVAKSIDRSIGEAKRRIAEMIKIPRDQHEYSRLLTLAEQVLAGA